MRPGVRIALDLGSVRVGVAKSDASGLLASPYAVWKWSDAPTLASAVRQVVDEWQAFEVLIGLPIDLAGRVGPAAEQAREVAVQLAGLLPVPVRLVDERLTTASARKRLQESGYSTRSDRALIDAAAATVLLEDALAAERGQGKAPGELVE